MDELTQTDVIAYLLQCWSTLYAQGGFVVVVLIGGSTLGGAIVIEKLVRLRSGRMFQERVAERVLRHLRNDQRRELQRDTDNAPAPMTEMVLHVTDNPDRPRDERLDGLSSLASRWLRRASVRLRVLGILASVSPLLGILGTVLGMIRSMGEVSRVQAADPMVVGQGISQALITTAVGLGVGIPMMIAHGMLKGRINRYAAQFEEFGRDLVRVTPRPVGATDDDIPARVSERTDQSKRTPSSGAERVRSPERS